jgi:hypothetical protein
MRTAPRKFLAVALAVALPIAFCRRPPEPDPAAEPVISGVLGGAAPGAVALRVLAKGQLALDVAARRRSLVEAAALFRELDRLPPAPARPAWLDPTLHIPADTEEGRLCRQVVAAVRAELGAEPDRAAAAVARLEAAFWEELRRHGEIRLPDPDSLTPVQQLLEQARLGHGRRNPGRSPRGLSSDRRRASAAEEVTPW